MMIVMGIIAVLIVIAYSGIQLIQPSFRDNERQNVGESISREIKNYQARFLEYPTSLNFTPRSGQTAAFVEDQSGFFDYTLASGFLNPETETSSSSTEYFYSRSSDGYQLCIMLESGSIASFGNVECPSDI